jgi:hypothetical protein
MNVPRLDKFTYKIAISSPAHFSGEMQTDSFWLTHAWPMHKNNMEIFDPSGRFHRSFFMLTFRERELSKEEEKKRQPPWYDFVGDYFCVLLSAYFGKRFDNLGFVQSHGIHCVPDIQPPKLRKLVDALPTSSKPRKDLGIKLELHEAKPLLPILDAVFLEINENKPVAKELELAFAAGRFYLQALQLFESDPELAFLSLVSAGEVLVSGLDFSGDGIYDKDTEELLIEIKEKLGDVKADKIRRIFRVSRKFRVGLSKLVNKTFFEGSESQEEFYKFKPDEFDMRIAAAYDLRSNFLHAGKRFGVWTTILDYRNAEVSIGTPAYGDADWKKLISRIPTLVGMERVIRFCLLRFLHQKVSPLHEKLN